MSRVSIVSLGCPKNLVDSENLLSGLRDEGFLYTTKPDDADIVLVNTCGFIEEAKRESIEEILRLKHMKEEGKKLLVFGCLAKRYRDDLIKEIPEIDAIWGVGEEDGIIEYCKRVMKRRHGDAETQRNIDSPIHPFTDSPIRPSGSYAYLKIAEGCSRGCAFCVIPSIRGTYRSIEPDKVLRKAEKHIESGVRELILVAQDISSYGMEFHGYNLSSLLRDLSSISGEFWIRLLYLYPASIDDELLTVIAGEDKICKYLDIPLQHSEDKILKAMGRSGTKKWHVRLIRRIREAIPDITIRTTLIAGFPGETEEDFAGLKGFVEDMRFDRLGVFMYSKEDGTLASRMKGNIARKVKEKRRDEIMRIQSYISLEKNRSIIGRIFKAIVDEVDGKIAIARLYSQAPEIDGVVFVSNNSVLKAGEFTDVLITEAYDYDLKGELVG
ncbi:MAG: 30S ribosomal protein S12 methylthiotransferase RimO [Thermodesulfovibrionales bacterium]